MTSHTGESFCKRYKKRSTVLELSRDSSHSDGVGQVIFSSCGKMVAVASGRTVCISVILSQSPFSQEIIRHSCVHLIQYMSWSPDSAFLLLTSVSQCRSEIICPTNPDWLYEVQDPQNCGIVAVLWLPSSQHIITVSDFSVHSLVHAVKGGSPIALPGVCCSDTGSPLIQFSPDGLFFAFIRPSVSGYHLVLVCAISLSILWSTQPDCVKICGLLWSPDSPLLAVWDNPWKNCVHFYNLDSSIAYTLRHSDTTCPGFKVVSFSPCGKIFASVSNENEVHIHNTLTWHLARVLKPNEVDIQLARKDGHLISFCANESVMKSEEKIVVKGAVPHPSHKSRVVFSTCGNFMASVTKITNSFVCVWNVRNGFLLSCVLHFESPVSDLLWNPDKLCLAVSDGSHLLVLWHGPTKCPSNKLPSSSTYDTGIDSVAVMQWLCKKRLAIVSFTGKAAIISVKHKS